MLGSCFLSRRHTQSSHFGSKGGKRPATYIGSLICAILVFLLKYLRVNILNSASNFCQETSCRIRIFCFCRKEGADDRLRWERRKKRGGGSGEKDG